MAVKASRTSSSLNGLMIAITIFMGPIPAGLDPDPIERSRLKFTTQRYSRRGAQPVRLESNAVPEDRAGLTNDQICGFRGFAAESEKGASRLRPAVRHVCS